MIKEAAATEGGESLHEWHVVVSPDTDEVCNSNGFEAVSQGLRLEVERGWNADRRL